MDAEVKLEQVDIKEELLDEYDQEAPLEDIFCPTTGEARPRAVYNEFEIKDEVFDRAEEFNIDLQQTEIHRCLFCKTLNKTLTAPANNPERAAFLAKLVPLTVKDVVTLEELKKNSRKRDMYFCLAHFKSEDDVDDEVAFEMEEFDPTYVKEEPEHEKLHRCYFCKTLSKTLTAPSNNPERAAFLSQLIPLTVKDVVTLDELKKNSGTRDMYFCLAHFKTEDEVDDEVEEEFDPTYVKEESEEGAFDQPSSSDYRMNLFDRAVNPGEIKEEPDEMDEIRFDDLSQPSTSRDNVNWIGVVPTRQVARGSVNKISPQYQDQLRAQVKFYTQKDAVSRILDRIEQNPSPSNPAHSSRFNGASRTIPEDVSRMPRASRKRPHGNDSSMKSKPPPNTVDAANLLDDSFVDDLFKTMQNPPPAPAAAPTYPAYSAPRVTQASRMIRPEPEASRGVLHEDSSEFIPSRSSTFNGPVPLSARGGPPKDSARAIPRGARSLQMHYVEAPFKFGPFEAFQNDALRVCFLCGRTPGLCFEVPCDDEDAREQLLCRMLPRNKKELILLESLKLEDNAAIVCASHLKM